MISILAYIDSTHVSSTILWQKPDSNRHHPNPKFGGLPISPFRQYFGRDERNRTSEGILYSHPIPSGGRYLTTGLRPEIFCGLSRLRSEYLAVTVLDDKLFHQKANKILRLSECQV